MKGYTELIMKVNVVDFWIKSSKRKNVICVSFKMSLWYRKKGMRLVKTLEYW